MSATADPTRIAFCITDLDPGGAERALVQLVTRLDRDRWTPAVYCLSGPGVLADELRAASVPVACLGAQRRTDVWVIRTLRAELRRFQPRIVQTFLFHANLAGRLAATRWLGGGPIIVSGIRVAERRSRWPLRLERWSGLLVDAHVCVSRAVAEYSATAGGLPRGRLTVIPNGVDAAAFPSAPPLELSDLGLPPGAQIVVSVGRLEPQKGLSILLDAAARLLSPRDTHPNLYFLIVGKGALRGELERQAAAAGIAERVRFLDWRPDVPRVLRTASILALPSLWEGMPNVVLEAMAAGLSVVATRVEGVEELVVENETGLIVPPGSGAALAEGLDRLLRHPERAAAMGQAGQARAQAEFTWEQMVARYDALYDGLLTGRAVGSPLSGN